MSEPAEISYGRYYWYVKLTQQVSDKGETYVQADEVQVKDGVLLFLQNQEEGVKITMAFAPGTWLSAYITSLKKE
ncbi:MAG: hypothetical protein SXA11_03445 [Cyanobacteriota bacterium]|nr:hypothetical protein [Cyanobacteriota bacterium]